MHLSRSLVLFGAVSLAVVSAFDPITLTVGTTAFVASGASVGTAAIVLAGLAIAKEALIFAGIKTVQARRNRGRRQADAVQETVAQVDSFDMAPIFKAIVESDTDNCAKAMVCHAFATPENQRSPLETKVVHLMGGELQQIHKNPALGVFQVAAIAGNTGHSHELCSALYSSCTKTKEDLANLVPTAASS